MKVGKYFLAVTVGWVVVVVLDAITNFYILSSSWKSVAAHGIMPKADPAFVDSALYALVLYIAVAIMGLFYAYGGRVCGIWAGKLWMGFGCGTLVNIRLITQAIYTELPFSIVALGLITTWAGFLAAVFLLAKVYGPGDWAGSTA
ncbi:hypothetical protein KAR34_13390 [bacterium]|nr:hypothetical protein [bacterium]